MIIARPSPNPCRARLLTAAAVLSLSVAAVTLHAGQAATAASPTARSPKLLWSPEQQGIWQKMRAAYEGGGAPASTRAAQWFGILKRNAECACRYGDNGVWATLMYQITGERRYVDLAWARLSQGFLKRTRAGLIGNYAREYSAELVVMYDWLRPALSSVQRDQFLAKLNEMFSALVEGNRHSNPAMPIRTADSDQTVGNYFGLVFHFLATSDHNPTATALFSRPFIGGLDATGLDRSTLRNAVAQYATELAAGGEWMESSDYNLGTVRLLVLGAQGVRTATGLDHFPEVGRFAKEAALRQIYMLTPDRRGSVQWGDEESPRLIQSELFAWQTTNGVLAGVTQGDSGSGPYIQALTYDLVARYGASGYRSAEPWARFFFLFNPFAPSADHKTLPLNWYARGQGLLIARDSWNEQGTLVAFHLRPKQPGVDHQVSYFGDFQMYRRGEWAITHPMSYAGPSLRGEGTNTMIIGSFSSMAEFKAVLAQEHAADGSYTYISGTTGGQKAPEGSYDPPPTFLDEWTRSLVYLPSRDARSDTIVVHDRVNARNPRNLPKFNRYRTQGPNEQAAISAMSATKQWIVHAPTEPRLDATGLSWSTAGGQSVVVDTLLPAGQRRLVYDERLLWPETAVLKGERKWQVRILPPVEREWDTFLNVVQVFDEGTNRSNVLVSNTGSDTDAALVRREGHNDAVLVFNTRPAPALPDGRSGPRSVFAVEASAILSRARVRNLGYTLQWTAGSPATDLLIFDLNPNEQWQLSIDGGSPAALDVSAGGVGRASIHGPGARSLQVQRLP